MFRAKIQKLRMTTPSGSLRVVARDVSRDEDFNKMSEKLFKKKREHPVFVGESYVARMSPLEYSRVTVKEVDVKTSAATVEWVDAKTTATVPLDNLRLLQKASWRKMGSLCHEYVLAGLGTVSITDKDKEITKAALNALHRYLFGKVFDFVVVYEGPLGMIVDMKDGEKSVSDDIIPNNAKINKGITYYTVQEQIDKLAEQKAQKDRMRASAQKEPTEIVYNTTHQARVDHFEPKTSEFSVQFIDDDILRKEFQADLQKFDKKTEALKAPKKGMRGLVRKEDNQLYRVEVVQLNDKDKTVVVRLLETGEIMRGISITSLYSITTELMKVAAYAKQFKLYGSGMDYSEKLGSELASFFFKYLTAGKTLELKVETTHYNVPTCRLYDYKTSILEEMNKWKPFGMKYPAQKPLSGDGIVVGVTAISSPGQFFIMQQTHLQLKQEIEKQLEKIDPPKLAEITAGNACIVKLDNKFVRGRIIEKKTKIIWQIIAVDTGLIDDVLCDDIRVSVKKLAQYPPLAFRCYLDGYYWCQHEAKITKVFESLCTNRFKMDVVKQKGATLAIKLYDCGTNGNVLEKLEAADIDSCKLNESSRVINPSKLDKLMSTINTTYDWTDVDLENSKLDESDELGNETKKVKLDSTAFDSSSADENIPSTSAAYRK